VVLWAPDLGASVGTKRGEGFIHADWGGEGSDHTKEAARKVELNPPQPRSETRRNQVRKRARRDVCKHSLKAACSASGWDGVAISGGEGTERKTFSSWGKGGPQRVIIARGNPKSSQS